MAKKRDIFHSDSGTVNPSIAEVDQRREELYALKTLDTPTEEAFDRITETVSKIFNVPFCLITLVTEDREWIKSSFGISELERNKYVIPFNESFCQYVVEEKRTLTTTDLERILGIKEKGYNIQFYAGAPLMTSNQHVLGTLCILDNKPRTFSKEDKDMLERFAQWAMSEIQLLNRLLMTNRREQFLTAFYEITSDDQTTINLKIEQLLTLGCEHFGYSNGGVATLEPDQMIVKAYYGENKDKAPEALKIDRAIFEEVAIYEEPIHYQRNKISDSPVHHLLKSKFTFDEMFGYRVINKEESQPGNMIIFLYLHTPTEHYHPVDHELLMIITQWISQVYQSRKAQEKLIDSEMRYRMIIESANDAIILADEHLTIQSWNPAAEKIFQYKKDEAIGQKVNIIIPEKYLPNHLVGVERFKLTLKGRVMGRTTELEGRRKDGHCFPLELSLYTWRTDKGLFFGCMVRDITERKRDQDLINDLAYNDTLTGLKNRTSFYEKMDKYFEREESFGLLFIDIDGFKAVNDTFGHTKGDLLLQAIAERLHNVLARPGMEPYRYGGDEFLVVIDHPDLMKLTAVKREIIKSLTLPYYLQGDTIQVSASIGESMYPDHGEDLNMLLKVADSYMYQMKQKGGGRALIN